MRARIMQVEALFGLAVFDIRKRSGFARAVRLTGALPNPGRAGDTGTIVRDACAAVDCACGLYPRTTACLQRSIVLTRLLRRHGVAAILVLGAQHYPFFSHAWVEVDGRVVNDRAGVQIKYLELCRI